MTVAAPNLREANCQAIFLFPFSQLNKLKCVQWNWSPDSWVHSALLPVRLHLAVNSDRPWTVIHITLVDIHTETLFSFYVSLPPSPSFLSFSLSVSDCDRLPLSPKYDSWWVAQQCNKPLVFIQRTPQRWQCLFSLLWERQNTVGCSPFEGVVGGLGQGGLFITSGLCTGLWGDVLSVFDDCY